MSALHHRGRRVRARALAPVAAALVVMSLTAVGAAAQRPSADAPKPTIVLVHGAFADAGGWNGVSERLVRKGYNVIAPANPLRGLSSDVQYLKDFLDTVPGPIVLVGHSYGGFVMTNAATGDPDVEALVYIAAFAPDAGETVGGISASAPGSMLGPAALTIRPYVKADGSQGADGYITPTLYREVFAADLPRADAWTFAVSQRPAELSILTEPSGDPAWKTIPSWTMVAGQDRVIPPDAQRAMAARAGATTVEATGSHSIAVAHPGNVADFIVKAAKAVG
jgi:pimeloyl-ACP methyl ester carboxylesterase